jgi:hypothetical protein
VPEATITSQDLGLAAISDSQGRFYWLSPLLSEPAVIFELTVQAPGFGRWIIRNVRLLRGDTLQLDIALRPEPVEIVLPDPAELAAQRTALPPAAMPPAPEQIPAADLTLPETIRVRVTGYPYCDLTRPYTVTVVPFQEYVKHVLPNEWAALWHRESLRAGAMAAKSYAWYWISRGGKWSDADVYDSTCDQVYNPVVSYASTDMAVEDTWRWALTRTGALFQTSYRHTYDQCLGAGLAGECMGQVDSNEMAKAGSMWDEILQFFYDASGVQSVLYTPLGGHMIYFHGAETDEIQVVAIPLDDPQNANPGPPVDVGQGDFTIEWWLKTNPSQNQAPAVTCGPGEGWREGNVILDRDRKGQDRSFAVALADRQVVIGVIGEGGSAYTLCGTQPIADGDWHHLVFQRRQSDGYLWLYIDGQLDAEADGPEGDISYPDDGVPLTLCGATGQESCEDDIYLFIGGEKYNQPQSPPSSTGWLDEVRISNTLRYPDTLFLPPRAPFTPDENTLALYHFDTGYGRQVLDSSGAPGGPSDGLRLYYSPLDAPTWELSDLFLFYLLAFPLVSSP